MSISNDYVLEKAIERVKDILETVDGNWERVACRAMTIDKKDYDALKEVLSAAEVLHINRMPND